MRLSRAWSAQHRQISIMVDCHACYLYLLARMNTIHCGTITKDAAGHACTYGQQLYLQTLAEM